MHPRKLHLFFFQKQEQEYDLIATNDKSEEIELRNLNHDHPKTMSTLDVLIKGIPEKDIENYGFVLFSLIFVVFNLIYWPWLLVASDYFQWDVDLTYNVKDD